MNRTLKVLAVGDPAVYAYVDERFSIIENFNRENDATVEFTIVPWDEYYEKMMRVFEGEQKYDIVMVAGHLWLNDFVAKGYLAEVTPPETNDYDRDDILHVIAEEMKIDGRTYLYPSFCDGHILLYRKSIVKDAIGTVLPEAVTTDRILEVAKQCHGWNGMNGIAMKAAQSEIFTDFLPYLRNEDVDAFNEQDHSPTFNNDKGRRALEKYITLKSYAPEHTYSFGNDEVRESFQKKESALAVTWGGQLGVVLTDECLDLEDVGFAAIKSSWNVTWSFGINATSEKQELSNQFLAYLSSKEIDQIIGGYAGSPVRRSTYEKDSDKYPWYRVHLQLIETYAKPLPSMENAGEKTGPLYQGIYEAFTGNKEVAEALDEAEEQISKIDRRRS